jgi:hypothetical protein
MKIKKNERILPCVSLTDPNIKLIYKDEIKSIQSWIDKKDDVIKSLLKRTKKLKKAEGFIKTDLVLQLKILKKDRRVLVRIQDKMNSEIKSILDSRKKAKYAKKNARAKTNISDS